MLLPLMLLTVLAAPDPEVRVAVLPFNGVNITEEEMGFHGEHFAQQMALTKSLKVTSAQQIQTLLGLERQKELMGCADDASQCMAELANALGSEIVVAGSIGRFGDTFQVNVKALSPVTGEVLALVSGKASSASYLLEELTRLARRLVSDLRFALRKQADERARAARIAADEARRAEYRRKDEERRAELRRRDEERAAAVDGPREAGTAEASGTGSTSAAPSSASSTGAAALPLRPVATSASRASPLVITVGAIVGCVGLGMLATEYPLVGLAGIAAGGGIMFLGINWNKPEEKPTVQAGLSVGPGSINVVGRF